MSRLYRHIISDRTASFIDGHGMTLELTVDENPMQSRADVKTVWVGVDVPKLDNVSINDAAAYVSRYCKEQLDCTIDDIIWRVVNHFSVGHSMCFAVGESENSWMDNDLAGMFIYIKKEDLVGREYNQDYIKSLIRNAPYLLEKEVIEYNVWCNDEVYRAVIKPKQKDLSKDHVIEAEPIERIIINIDEQADEAVLQMLYEFIDEINHADDAVRFKVNIKDSTDFNQLPEQLAARAASTALIAKIENAFGFTPAFGDIDINESKSELTLTLSTETIPPFSTLSANARSSKSGNIFKTMLKAMGKIGVGCDSKVINMDDVTCALTESGSYTTWSPDMISSLLSVLIDSSKDFKFIEVVEIDFDEYDYDD